MFNRGISQRCAQTHLCVAQIEVQYTLSATKRQTSQNQMQEFSPHNHIPTWLQQVVLQPSCEAKGGRWKPDCDKTPWTFEAVHLCRPVIQTGLRTQYK
jgi:hypothetical protein